MKRAILIDGNNLLFRSYYATAYNGNLMKNSKGFPTNALYGFINMMNKIIEEEKPAYIMVAFDKGKTFRHDKYDFYNKLFLLGDYSSNIIRIDKLKERELIKYRRNDIGFVFQFYNLIQNMNVLENVELATQLCKDSLEPNLILNKVGLKMRKNNFFQIFC